MMLTDEQWRQFQAIPDQGYSHRAWVDARIDENRRATLQDARDAAERQVVLASLVAGRPTDFEKGVMSCMAAIDALIAAETHDHDEGGCTCGCPVPGCLPCGGVPAVEAPDHENGADDEQR